MYRTGDRARLHRAGYYEFLGRRDHQIKLRGVRIELAEIEQALLATPGVSRAAVALRESAGGEKMLVGFVVLRAGAVTSAGELRDSLSRRLPPPAVPHVFEIVEALPTLPNGKLDRARLGELSLLSAEKRPPQTETELRLASIWSELLGADHIGLDDSFFALGGHSLLAIRLVAEVFERMSVDIPLRAVFEAPTLEALAREVDARRQFAQREQPEAADAEQSEMEVIEV
jgi:acyl carrier protein